MSLHTLLPHRIGFGTAPLGNMFRAVPDAEALATVDSAWEAGLRFFDTAPSYGAGLAELRLGEALAGRSRADYVLATKVGRLVLDEAQDSSAPSPRLFAHGLRNRIVDDYSADATLRSIEGSLKRLRTDRIDIVWVHDVAQDLYGDRWIGMFESARVGAFRVLDRLRDEGVIGAWGLGVNRVEPIEILLALDEPRPDGFLLAGRYTLLDHDRALERVMPMVAAQSLGIVVGGPYSSGVLVGGSTFEYAPASPAILDRVARIRVLADRHGVSMKAAGLHFALANPQVAAVIPGATRPDRIAEDMAAAREHVPVEFWQDMRAAALINPSAPLPSG